MLNDARGWAKGDAADLPGPQGVLRGDRQRRPRPGRAGPRRPRARGAGADRGGEGAPRARPLGVSWLSPRAARRSRPPRTGPRRRRDHEQVEDLVVAEDGRVAGSGAGVRRRRRRPCRAAPPAATRATRRRSRRRTTIAGKATTADPAEREVDQRGHPLRRLDPDHLDDRADQRADPDRDQHRVGEGAVEDQQRERRVGAGDQQEDHRVVEAAHPAADVGPLPVDPVIEGAGAEQGREADRRRSRPRASPAAVRGEDQAGAERRARRRRPTRGETPRSRGLTFAIASAALGRVAGGGRRLGGGVSGGVRPRRRLPRRAVPRAVADSSTIGYKISRRNSRNVSTSRWTLYVVVIAEGTLATASRLGHVVAPTAEPRHTRPREPQGEDGASVRRRRECSSCGHRFTTYERREHAPLFVRKRDGARQPFDRAKLRGGLARAAHKRPVSDAEIDAHRRPDRGRGRALAAASCRRGGSARSASRGCAQLDRIAYLQFAAVYKQLDIEAVRAELARMTSSRFRESKAAAIRGHTGPAGSVRPEERSGSYPPKPIQRRGEMAGERRQTPTRPTTAKASPSSGVSRPRASTRSTRSSGRSATR